jgi:hypothetical protein
MKAIVGIVVALVIAIGGYLGYYYYSTPSTLVGVPKEITSEKIERRGDTWHVNFTAMFAAPIDQVFEAFQHPERAHEFVPENVMKSEIAKDEGNTKVVNVVGKLDILPPGFKVQNLMTEYTVFPAEKRISSKSINFKLADITSNYRFEPAGDGKATLLKFDQTSKDKAPLIVESLQKGALRETFATQVRAVNRALGLAPKVASAPQAG